MVQNENLFLGMEPIGEGGNSVVFKVVNPFFANIVLKKGPKAVIEQEADMLHAVRHPNIVSLAALVTTTQTTPQGKPAAFLALQRLETPLVNVTRYSNPLMPCPRGPLCLQLLYPCCLWP